MFPAAIAQNVAYVTGQPFFADGSGKNSMRLNFTYPSDDNIVEGVRRLANVIKVFNDDRLKAGSGPGAATPKAK
jgi:2-aminoadipate transaminase